MTRAALTHAKRVVVKVGSALLADGGDAFVRIAQQVVALRARGISVVLVSSGAIALGLSALKYATRPKDLASLQACAAAGQSKLMALWDDAFARHDVAVAQVLLTHEDLRHRHRYLNARQALFKLVERGAVAVVNENDTVATAEIKLGDNDTLAAQVCGLVDADLVVLLTQSAGLFTADPSLDASATRIATVDDIDAVRVFAGGAAAFGTGGMVTKLDAAAIARAHGASTVIAPGRAPDVLLHICAGDDVGTWLTVPPDGKAGARKRWILTTLRSRGVLVVDDGAVRALNNDASLLSAGVLRVEGDFGAGDAVDVVTVDGVVLAKGLVALSADDARRVQGKKSAEAAALLGHDPPDALIHKDDLVRVG